MTDKQIEELKIEIEKAKQAISEMELMLADYSACRSEVSKKYLGAAIKKQVSEFQQCVAAPAE